MVHSLEVKKAVLSSIGPPVLYDYVSSKLGNRVTSDYCTVEEVINLVEERVVNYSEFLREKKSVGIQNSKIGIHAAKFHSCKQ